MGRFFEKLGANITPPANIAASKFKSKFEQYITLNYVLVKLYENEIDRLQKMHVKDQISPAQKKQMLLEVKELENLCCCLGLKSGTRTLCQRHFAERAVCRKDNLPKIKMLFHQNVWDCDSFLNCVILDHCVK